MQSAFSLLFTSVVLFQSDQGITRSAVTSVTIGVQAPNPSTAYVYVCNL